MTRRVRIPAAAGRQRGLVSLAVVMVLLFTVALVAAYTNRNLIFEQRTSANQFRSTQALETAQAGLDWAVAMLNRGRIDDTCGPSANVADPSFRQRFLDIDAATGVVTVRPNPGGGADLAAVCVFDGAAWSCTCPASGAALPAAPGGAGFFPAYRVRFATPSPMPPGAQGVVRVEVVGCPRLDAACLDFANPQGAEGRARIVAILGLFGGVKSPPPAALTARLAIDLDAAATVLAANGEAAVGGIAVQSGGAVLGGITATGIAGSPLAAVFDADPWLAGLAATASPALTAGERLFATTFGVAPGTWRAQSGAVVINGCPCSVATVRTAAALNPGRPIWVAGDLRLDSAGDVGSTAAPVALVVDGDVDASVAGITVHGLLYVRGAPWTLESSATVVGAAIGENGLIGSGGWQFLYSPPALEAVRVGTGTFAVVPGSWRDFFE